MRRHNVSLDWEQAVTRMRSWWRLADDELLPLGTRPVPRGTFRMVALGVIHAPDLGSALARLIDFLSITTGYPGIRMTVAGGTCRTEFGDVVGPFAAEILLAFTHRFSAWLSGLRLVLSGLDRPFPAPAHSAEYEPVLGRMPSFGGSAVSISFDGFSEPSAVRRAFTRWVGTPPGEYRDRFVFPS